MNGVMATEWWRDGYVETMGWVLVHSLGELAAVGMLTGAVLGTVSADRQSVVLTLHPELRALDKWEMAGTLPAVAPELFAQLPKMRETEINTMVRVPARKAVVLGGMKWAGEFPTGADGNWTLRAAPAPSGAVVRNLVMLVKPEIIVHREMEN